MLDKELLLYIKSKGKYIVFIVISNVINLLTSLSITFLFVFSIHDFITNDFNNAFIKISLILLLLILKIIFQKISSLYSVKLADYVTFKLRNDSYKKFLNIHGKTPFTTQEMAQLSTEGIEQLRLYYSSYLPSFFYAMIAPVILFIIFIFIDTPVAFTYLICVPLIPVSIILVSKWAKKIFNKYWNIYTSLGDSFLDNISGMKELKIFLYDEIKAKEMMNKSEEFRKITMKVLTMQLASITIIDLVAYGGAGIGIVLSLIAMNNGLNIYLTLFLILVGAEFFLPLRSLGSSFHVAMNGATAGKKVIKLLNENDYIDGQINIKDINKIQIKNIKFKYSDNTILNNVSLTLNKGFNCLVGLSGSGKSTLAKLCSKIERTNDGEILINDVNINNLSSKSFYKKACYVSNNTFLFHETIRDIFKFYNAHISEQEMLSLLNEVKLSHFSLDLKINDQNSNISGGEKQRLILAFYLSKEYDFYIFDEATSNIDSESEEIILEKIHELAKNKIILFISHRLKNCTKANIIYYLSNGEIIEQGAFNELMSIKSEFSNLYKLQNELENGGEYEKA